MEINQAVISSVSWVIPKTDWKGHTDEDGIYSGDRFNAEDYNRIKNNLQYLRDLAVKMYPDFNIDDMGSDKGYADYPYADEINLIESNLDTITENTIKTTYGTKPIFVDNGAFIDFSELNRIESATLDIYNKLSAQYDGRRMCTFMLGSREVFGNGMGNA